MCDAAGLGINACEFCTFLLQTNTSNMDIDRHIVSIKLLGKEKNAKKSKVKAKSSFLYLMCTTVDYHSSNNNVYSLSHDQQQDFAIEVMLSDESVYTVYRSKKQIASFNVSVVFIILLQYRN